MHIFNTLASLTCLLNIASAHNSAVPGAPQIFGRRAAANFRHRRNKLPDVPRQTVDEPSHIALHDLDRRKRQNTSGQCGAGFGSCAAGYCCSGAGFCGQGDSYCAAPDCQFNYGPACDANATPPGTNTSTVSRTKLGSTAYGGNGIVDCTVNGMIALTFDDGPYIYTSDILDILDKYNVKATFFITGNNLGKGEIDNAATPWPAIIQRMYKSGHQIASHTWSHQDLSTEVTHVQRMDQMYKNEMALRNIIQVFPTYMRPPYSSCTAASGCQADMKALGYHVTLFDLDTEDYLNDSPNMIQTSKNDFASNISTNTPSDGNWLAIAHDIHEQTAHNLTEYMITTGLAAGWKFGTVGQCLGDPQANWYRSSSGSLFTSTSSAKTPSATSTPASSASATPSSPTSVSDDATCAGSTGKTCLNSNFGNCCSINGYCGSSSAYCGTGCQPGFGNCGSNNASASSTSSGAMPSSTLTISPDATCGGSTGYTCAGSSYGNCCSAHGFCGSTTDYCIAGCQLNFGLCGSSAIASNTSGTATTTPISGTTSQSAAGTVSIASSNSTTTLVSTVTVLPVPVTTLTPSISNSSTPVALSTSSSSSSSTSVLTSSSTFSTSLSTSSTFSSITSSSKAPSTSLVTSTTSSSTSPSTSKSSTPAISSSSTSSTFSTASISLNSSPTSTSSKSTSLTTSNKTSATTSKSTSTNIMTTSTASKSSSSISTSTSTISLSSSISTTSKASPTSAKLTSTPSPSLSTNGRCGADVNMTCDGILINSCCGANGYCTTGLGCMRMFGCQDGFSSMCI